MKIKNSEVVSFINNTNEIVKKKLPVKLGYAIGKNLKNMSSIAELYNTEYKKIKAEYEKSEDGNKPIIEDMAGFIKEVNELLSIDNEFDMAMVSMAVLDDLDNPRYDSLTPEELSVLDIMIE